MKHTLVDHLAILYTENVLNTVSPKDTLKHSPVSCESPAFTFSYTDAESKELQNRKQGDFKEEEACHSR